MKSKSNIFSLFNYGICMLLIFYSNTILAQFVPNNGQWDSEILFKKSIYSGSFLLSEKGISLLFYDDIKMNELAEKHHQTSTTLNKNSSNNTVLKYHHILIQFINGQIKKENIYTQNAYSHTINYILGNDKSKWKGNIKAFKTIKIKHVYTNIDLEIIEDGGKDFKYNFIINPGGKLSDIKIKYEGAQKLDLLKNKLSITTSINTFIEEIPISFKINNKGQTQKVLIVPYLDTDILKFKSLSDIDLYKNDTLVVDPKLVFSTYSGTTADNFGFTATYDKNGNLYAGGITTSSYVEVPGGRFPSTIGSFDGTYNGGSEFGDYEFPCDITISKYSPDGKTLIYATYIGGSHNEYPHSLIVDEFEQLVIMGTSFSSNYPVSNNAYQTRNNGMSDIIVSKLNYDGSDLVGSTYYGGSGKDGLNEHEVLKYFYADNFRGDVNIDNNRIIYGASCSQSPGINIKNGFDNYLDANQEGLLFSFNENLTDLMWSTFVGKDGATVALYSIDFDNNKKIYISGGITDNGLDNSSNTVNPNYLGGDADGFIAIISNDGTAMEKSTYWGTNAYDQIYSLDFDFLENLYIVGQTRGKIPTKGNVYSNANAGQFLARLNKDLSTFDLSTTFGVSRTNSTFPDITINAFMVDECQRVFLSGWGGIASQKGGSTTRGLPITSDAAFKTTDGSDFYLLVMGKDFNRLVYASYIGGTQTNDHVDGGTSRFDKKGIIYQSVCSSCPNDYPNQMKISDFPTTKGAYAEKNKSPRCSNAAFKFSLENLNRKPIVNDTFLSITAFDTLDFDYFAYDPDSDSLFLNLIDMNNIKQDFDIYPNNSKGISPIKPKFKWIPKCKHISKDTFKITVYLRDKGCPDIKYDTATIKIKVNTIPILLPPKTVCAVIKNNKSVEISWDPILPSKYFGYIILYKKLPNGSLTILDTFYSQNAIKLIDNNVVNPNFNNYVYYVKVFNKCNEEGLASIEVSTTKEIESPINTTYVLNATVINNKDVEINWEKSTELDFSSYQVFRTANIPKLDNWEFIGEINLKDSLVFIDKKVDVQSQSFCYSVAVTDLCGHVSKKSNIGCNIILSGESKPFYFNLKSEPYRNWDAGVDKYILERSVDTGILRPIGYLTQNRTFMDNNLDYDWGGYWYSVLAIEGIDGKGTTSRSNAIYLIQPPLLHVPNVFTKNDDNLNETWGFVDVFVKEYHMQVYNRWGQKVFDSKDKNFDWKAINEKETLQTNNVFFWQVTYTGWDRSIHYDKGTVTIIY